MKLNNAQRAAYFNKKKMNTNYNSENIVLFITNLQSFEIILKFYLRLNFCIIFYVDSS